MDKITQYRQIISDVIVKYAQFCPSHGKIRLDPVLDEKRDRYALMQVGWDRGKRIRGNIIYITIEHEKICIQYDGLETGITQELLDRGISEEDIILVFNSPTRLLSDRCAG